MSSDLKSETAGINGAKSHRSSPPKGKLAHRRTVEVMAAALWRLRRLLSIETHQFDLEMVRRKQQIDADLSSVVHEDRLAFVFQKLSDTGNSLALLFRYQLSINHSYDKALEQLLQLQSTRPVGSFRIRSTEPRPSGRGCIASSPTKRAATMPGGVLLETLSPSSDTDLDSHEGNHANDPAAPKELMFLDLHVIATALEKENCEDRFRLTSRIIVGRADAP